MSRSLKKTLLFVLVFIGLALVAFKIYRKVKTRRIVSETFLLEHWVEKYNEFEGAQHAKGCVIFLGNSLTEAFNLSVFGDSTIVNRGIDGDFTEGVLRRLHQVSALQPSKLFIEIGINDIFEKVPPDEILENYEKIVERIKKDSPKTKIYIQSNLPVLKEGSFLTSGASLNRTIREQNEELKKLAVQQNVTYINLYDHFVKNGALDPHLSFDGVHINNFGYDVWKEVVFPYIKD